MRPEIRSDLLPPLGQWTPVVVLLWAALWTGTTWGQSPQFGRGSTTRHYVQTHWTPENGLPVKSVNDLLQTKDRHLWLATFDGLVRFDGRSFKTYRSGQYDGLPSSRIVEIITHSERLWLRTQQGHLVQFAKRDSFATVAHEVTSVRSGPAGRLWIGLEDGVALWTEGALQRIASDRIRGQVQALLPAQDGSLWIGTASHGAYRRGPSGQIRQFAEGEGLPTSNVTALAEGEDGVIWIGTDRGLVRWDGGMEATASPASPLHVRALQSDRAGRCWVRTDGGIYRCDSDRVSPLHRTRTTPDSRLLPTQFAVQAPDGRTVFALNQTLIQDDEPIFESESYITDLKYDVEGSLWVATATNGLYRLRPSLFALYGVPEGLESGNIYPIEQTDDGDIWLGTLGGGVTQLTPSGPVTHHLEKAGITLSNVWALHEDPSGQLWIGGGSRLCAFQDGQCAHPDEEGPVTARVRAIHGDTAGRLWVGAENGLHRRSDGQWRRFTPRNSGLPHPHVRALREGPTGALWLGTNGGGVARYKNGTFTPLTAAAGLSSDLIRDVYPDTTGVVWVVTEDAGLNRVVLSESETSLVRSVTVYRKEDGLHDNAIHRIIEDDQHRFWISSNRGIFWVKRTQLEAFARGEIDEIESVAYATDEGLRSREANGGVQPAGMQAQDGQLWFPTQEGAAVIDPATIESNPSPPPVFVERVASSDSVAAGSKPDHVHLGADQRDFNIRYTGISLTDPASVKFRYRLRGLQSDWVKANGRREAFFTNVPPGTYEFEVAAQRKAGDWSEVPARLTITVAPFFYETWWFYTLCILGLGLVGYGIVSYRMYALRRRKEVLNRKVSERTKQLEEARKKALGAAQAKSRFLANMSHEIRTPMNGVIGFADLLADTTLTQEQREFVEAIQNSGTSLLSIINDILDFSKLEAGEVTLEHQPVRVQACVDQALDALATRAASKNLEMTYLVDAAVPPVIKADETRLRQVLINLLSNAVKFTEEGEVSLRVRAAATPDDPDESFRLHFSVHDTGIGIPEEKQDELFDSFAQADSSTTRVHGGTGLGLSICKRIVEAMEGEIWVESEPDGGSTFHFTFEAEAAEAPADEEPRADGPRPSLEDQHVLIVDDNKTNRELLVQLVERWGMESTVAASGYELLEDVEETGVEFDLALLDVQMPEMDGLTLADRLRSRADGTDLPIVMLSSIQRHGKETDATYEAWLHKPIKQSNLYDVIAKALGSSEEPRAQPGDTDTSTTDQVSRTVLLVEDDLVNQKMTTQVLQKMGHQVTVAENGLEALEALRKQNYDVVLMDVQMPEMDGLEATRRIREDYPTDEQPHIVALTAAVMEEDRERCQAAGMDAFLSKPVKIDDLRSVFGSRDGELPEVD